MLHLEGKPYYVGLPTHIAYERLKGCSIGWVLAPLREVRVRSWPFPAFLSFSRSSLQRAVDPCVIGRTYHAVEVVQGYPAER
uniref:Uncharacterized protein n=1 Tax=Anguilla anguilla TaxID=7936 RepID=A0A0E9QUI6_ANGAN